MPNPKPSDLFRWADSGGAIAVPPAGVKDIGWILDAEVPAEYLNYLHNGAYQWAAYLSTFTDNALTWAEAQRFTLAARFDAGADTYGAVQGKATTDAVGVVGDIIAPTDTWRLFAWSKLTAGDIYARRYVSGSGLAVIDTINAAWSEGTGKWVADAAGTDAVAEKLDITAKARTQYYKAAAANWATWDSSEVWVIPTAAPSIAINNAVAGAGATASIVSGNDHGGVLQIATAVAAPATGTYATFTFATPRGTAPGGVILMPQNGAALGQLQAVGGMVIAVNKSATKWDISIPTVALNALTTYQWEYVVSR